MGGKGGGGRVEFLDCALRVGPQEVNRIAGSFGHWG